MLIASRDLRASCTGRRLFFQPVANGLIIAVQLAVRIELQALRPPAIRDMAEMTEEADEKGLALSMRALQLFRGVAKG